MNKVHLGIILIMISITPFTTGQNNIQMNVNKIEPNQNYLLNIDHYIQSDYTSRNYSLKVELPLDYNTNGLYPVIIVLDYLNINRGGNVRDLHQDLGPYFNYTQESDWLRPSILVDVIAVDFDTADWFVDIYYERVNFFNFIQNELVPFLNSTYSINQNELTLASAEYGAIFTLWAYYTYPTSIFKHFISAEGIYNYDIDLLVDAEEEFSQWALSHEIPSRSLFVGVNYSSRGAHQTILKVMISMFSRGYQNQNIVFEEYQEEAFYIFVVVIGWFQVAFPFPQIKFKSNIEVGYDLDEIPTPFYYVNETVSFMFTGSMGFHEMSYEWFIHNESIGFGNSVETNFTTIDETNVTLAMTLENGTILLQMKTVEPRARPPPPFDFHTVESTSLNTEAYKTRNTNTDPIGFVSLPIFIAIIIPLVGKYRYKRKS